MTKMKDKIIKDYSVSGKSFQLKYDADNELYQTLFSDWEHLNDYYQSENYISHTDGNRNALEKIYQIVKQYTIKTKWDLIKKHQNKDKINVLDIGCGTGDFLKYGNQKNNSNGVGVEPNDVARQKAQSKNVVVFNDLKEIKAQNYDVITLWHVLEHVPDIENYFSFFNEKLHKDGLLVIAVPNFKSYDAKFYGEHWAAWDVPRHLWHFSKNSMQKISQTHAFDLTHIQPMYFDSFYVSLLSEKYKNGKQNLLKAFWVGLRSNWEAKRTKEYSSHIYLFKKSK